MTRTYNIGDIFYKKNRNNELEKIQITDIMYKFDKRIGSCNQLNCEQINNLVNDEKLYVSKEQAKQTEIQKLEEKYGITLKEV